MTTTDLNFLESDHHNGSFIITPSHSGGCGVHKTFYGLIMEVARLVMSGDVELILQPFVRIDLGVFGFMQ